MPAGAGKRGEFVVEAGCTGGEVPVGKGRVMPKNAVGKQAGKRGVIILRGTDKGKRDVVGGGGWNYDAAGDVNYDGRNGFTYDAEGNVIAAGLTQYLFDALGRRIEKIPGSGDPTQYVYDASGHEVEIVDGATNTLEMTRFFFEGRAIASLTASGTLDFEHRDWLGTLRMLTNASGAQIGNYSSFPYGDGYAANGVDNDMMHFTLLDHDPLTNTDHADARDYDEGPGRWASPDLYACSYDWSNPQSFNRYAYVANNPLALVDPSGQDGGGLILCPLGPVACVAGFVGSALLDFGISELFSVPSFHGTLKPRPNAQPWDEYNIIYGPNIAGALGLPDNTCEFGPCGGVGLGLSPGSSNFAGPLLLNIPPQVFALSSFVHSLFKSDSSDDPYQKRLFGTHYCGIGGEGNAVNELDKACAAHDLCYGSHGFSAFSDYNASLYTTGQAGALQTCNQALCDAARGPASGDLGSSRVSDYFTAVPVGPCSF